MDKLQGADVVKAAVMQALAPQLREMDLQLAAIQAKVDQIKAADAERSAAWSR